MASIQIFRILVVRIQIVRILVVRTELSVGKGWIVQGTHLVGAGGLDALGRPEHEKVGHGAQRGEVLDRLVGGAIPACAGGQPCKS